MNLTNPHSASDHLGRSGPHEPRFVPSHTTIPSPPAATEAADTVVATVSSIPNVSRYKLMSPAKLPISRSMPHTAPPGLSPSSLLDSPVQFCNIKVEPSPTTGTLHKPQPMLGGVGYAAAASTSYANNSACVGKISDNSEFGTQSQSNFATGSSLLPSQAFPVTESQQYELQSQHIEGEKAIQYATASPPDQNEVRLAAVSDNSSTDGYNWRKYGQKHVKGCEFPRSYYKCTHPNCEVKKLLERNHDGRITEVIYKGTHAHPKPQSKRRFPNDSVMGTTDEHLERFSYQSEEMTLGASAATPDMDGTSEFPSGPPSDEELNDDKYDDDGDDPNSKRRKQDMGVVHFISSVKPIREPRVVVQTVSEVDILDDGYRWRKYGQKVVKGNPNPRSYYKCTNAGCPVRKHVERACHDIKSVITTYEGKHNHDVPAAKSNNQEASAAAVDPFSSYTANMGSSSVMQNDSVTQVSARYQLPPDFRNQYPDNEGENFRFATPYLSSNAYPQNLRSLQMGP
uniref:WRKY domain-containing protein n=2 Tax=Kalanchoe fedtschenkoi TaxID=63787 RepID=A0A7N0UQA1_KALFE